MENSEWDHKISGEINFYFLPSKGRFDGIPTRRGYIAGVAATLSIITRYRSSTTLGNVT